MSPPPDLTDYNALDAINWSHLKEMRRSPLHYRHRRDNPREDTTRLGLGRAAHTAILEPDRFALEYAVFKGKTRRGKAWDAFREQHEGDTILKRDEYELCLRIRDAVRANEAAAAYLARGRAEVPITWVDPHTRLRCKGRPDWISTSKPAIVDLKTTADVSENRFASTVARMGYHVQAAFYRDGYALSAGGEALPFVVIAVEVEPPHDVAVYRLDDDALWAGEREYQRLLADLQACIERDRWPGRYDGERVLTLPPWVTGSDEETIDGLDLVVNGHDLNHAHGG